MARRAAVRQKLQEETRRSRNLQVQKRQQRQQQQKEEDRVNKLAQDKLNKELAEMEMQERMARRREEQRCREYQRRQYEARQRTLEEEKDVERLQGQIQAMMENEEEEAFQQYASAVMQDYKEHGKGTKPMELEVTKKKTLSTGAYYF